VDAIFALYNDETVTVGGVPIRDLASLPDLASICYLRAAELRSSAPMSLISRWRWGRQICPVAMASQLAGNLPSPTITFPDMTTHFTGRLGLSQRQTIALIGGAHSCGRADRNQSGFARAWSDTPNVLDTAYLKSLDNTSKLWNLEPIVVTSTNINFPAKQQYELAGFADHTPPIMLPSDLNLGWFVNEPDTRRIASERGGPGCVVDHRIGTFSGVRSCPPRQGTATSPIGLDLISLFAENPATWVSDFQDAFILLTEAGGSLSSVTP